MKSIKPGRGPSIQGFIGSIATILFGIFWTFMTFPLQKNLQLQEHNSFLFRTDRYWHRYFSGGISL